MKHIKNHEGNPDLLLQTVVQKTQCISLQGANHRNERPQKILASKIPGAQPTICGHKRAFVAFIESPPDKVFNQSTKQRK